MRDRVYRVQAIILKRTDMGEADRLLTLYTRDHGKLRAIAKGARKPASRKSGHVELFMHSELLLARGRNLDIVTQAETRHAFLPLQSDLHRLGYAYYFAELLDQFTEDQVENRALYELILNTVNWLSEPATDAAILARYFELHVLALCGYRPQLFQCLHCGKELDPDDNLFSAEAGGVMHAACYQEHSQKTPEHWRDARPVSLNALKVLRFLQTREFETARALRLEAEVQNELEGLLHANIAHHLERKLKSVEFLHRLKRPIQPVLLEREK